MSVTLLEEKQSVAGSIVGYVFANSVLTVLVSSIAACSLKTFGEEAEHPQCHHGACQLGHSTVMRMSGVGGGMHC